MLLEFIAFRLLTYTLVQATETLVEFSQGCQANQEDIFNAKATDSLNFIIRNPSLNTLTRQDRAAQLLLACANLVLAMLEFSGPATESMARELEETLDIRQCFRVFHRYHEIAEAGTDKDWNADADEGDDVIEASDVSYAFYSVIQRLSDFNKFQYEDSPIWNPFVAQNIETFKDATNREPNFENEKDFEKIEHGVSHFSHLRSCAHAVLNRSLRKWARLQLQSKSSMKTSSTRSASTTSTRNTFG